MEKHKGESGIYKITNSINGKVYIGKTVNFYVRYKSYISYLRNNSPSINRYLKRSIDKYGFENFNFEVVEFCDIENLPKREEYWIKYYDSINQEFGYNLRLDTDQGLITHQLTREKLSESLRNQWKSGLRSGHSEKLAKSWDNRDRDVQSKLFSKTLTKYEYLIHNEDCDNPIIVNYSKLCKLGYKNSVATFCKKQTNKIIFKGVVIERREV